MPSAEFNALIQSISAAGGSVSFSLTDEDLGSPSFCNFSGALRLSVEGGGIGPNAPGSLATAVALIDGFIRTALPAISSRIRAVFTGAGTDLLSNAGGLTVSGMAACSHNRPPIGAWAGYSYTDSKNDFVTTAYSADRHNISLGLGTMPAENWLLGIAVTLERSSVTTRFNGGEQDATGISITPYMGYLLSDWLSLDAAIGVSTVSTDQFRTANSANSSCSGWSLESNSLKRQVLRRTAATISNRLGQERPSVLPRIKPTVPIAPGFEAH